MEFVPSRDLVHVESLRRDVAGGADVRSACTMLTRGLEAIRRASGLSEDGAVEQWVWLPGQPAGDTDEHAAGLDAFETRYIHTWLNAVIRWATLLGGELEAVGEACSAHLVLLAGQSAAGTLIHRYHFFTQDEQPRRLEEACVSVDVREVALTNDALGARTWGAATWLTLRLLRGTPPRTRVLELGAGTGLVGLAIAGQAASVVLTDYHPDVLKNLEYNAAQSPHASRLSVARLDWRDIYGGGRGMAERQEDRFGVVIAADCIYEAGHADWVAAAAGAHLSFPSTEIPQLHLCMALRATHTAETESVLRVFRDEPYVATARDGTRYALVMVEDERIDATDDFTPVSIRQEEPHGRGTLFWHVVVEWRLL